jgi:ABC-type branched-subunit amino acid transport system substrate-binding protein
LPQISFGASSVTLSDKNNFPLFARSCPNDARQSEVLVELLYAVEVHIIMVISTSDNPYSSYMASMIINGYGPVMTFATGLV